MLYPILIVSNKKKNCDYSSTRLVKRNKTLLRLIEDQKSVMKQRQDFYYEI
jgi:hypothetical protein